ncbi:MAG TPA: hypothetical protein VNS29_04160 [Burkholderiaceae bacterium]|nr:hypothetical protein [Burkholderiaceae bacterium]
MTLDRLTIILPWPDMSLMPNRKNGKHWGSTQAAKVRARQDGYFGAKQAMGTDCVNLPDRVPLSIDFIAPDRRARDIDNLLACIKPQIDGIAQALGIDDKRFRPITINDGLDTKKQGFVLVEIGV